MAGGSRGELMGERGLDVGFDVGFPAFLLTGLVSLLGKAGGKPTAKLARGGEKGLVFAR